MSIHPIAMLLPFLVFAALLFRGLRAALLVSAAALAMRTVAPVVLGSINVLVEHVCFSMILVALVYQWSIQRTGPKYVRIEVEPFILGLICAYSVFSALALPRAFRGIMVVSMSGTGGNVERYADNIMGLFLQQLEPSSGNLSQTAFVIYSAVIFVLFLYFGRRYGYRLLHQMVSVATIVHIIFGLADIAGLDSSLALMRTANYKINDGHAVMGLDRTIGMMSEASRYGIFGGVAFAYFFALWLLKGGRKLGTIAALALITDLSSISTSAFISIGGAFAVIAARFLLSGTLRRSPAKRAAVLVIGVLFGLLMVLSFTPIGGNIISGFDVLVLDKTDSQSGLLRAATTYQSFVTLAQTWLLGAGSGSVVANGLIPVWLGNIGLPGTILFLALYWFFMRGGPRLRGQSSDAYQYWFAATTAVATTFISEGVSRTILDPGLAIMLYGAIAVSTRRPLIIRLSAPRPPQQGRNRDDLIAGAAP